MDFLDNLNGHTQEFDMHNLIEPTFFLENEDLLQ
jgi:hypothetical protein